MNLPQQKSEQHRQRPETLVEMIEESEKQIVVWFVREHKIRGTVFLYRWTICWYQLEIQNLKPVGLKVIVYYKTIKAVKYPKSENSKYK